MSEILWILQLDHSNIILTPCFFGLFFDVFLTWSLWLRIGGESTCETWLHWVPKMGYQWTQLVIFQHFFLHIILNRFKINRDSVFSLTPGLLWGWEVESNWKTMTSRGYFSFDLCGAHVPGIWFMKWSSLVTRCNTKSVVWKLKHLPFCHLRWLWKSGFLVGRSCKVDHFS
jgi:hypothetical protein